MEPFVRTFLYTFKTLFYQLSRNSVKLILFEKYSIFTPIAFFLKKIRHPLSRCYMFSISYISTILFAQFFRPKIFKVVPQSGSFPVRHSVFAAINIIIFKLIHKQLPLQQSCLRIFNNEIFRFQVFYCLNCFQYNLICFINLSCSSRFRNAVFRAGRRSPDEIKIAYFIILVIPFQNVRINIGIFPIQ